MTPPAALDLLRQARVHNLLKAWAAGTRRLTSAEIAEIQAQHPDFQPSTPPAPASAGGEPLALTAVPAPSVGDSHVTGEQIAEWELLYDTKRRQLFRYLAEGRTHQDPCPLDRPAEMPAWWRRRMKHRCPDKIILAARAASSTSAEAPPPAAAIPSAPVPSDSAVAGTGFDFAADLNEGDEVRIARQLVAKFAAKLEEAMKSTATNAADEVQLWNRNLKDALETYRKHKSEDREAQKARGLLMPRGEAEEQIFAVLKTLAVMREVMAKRFTAEVRGRFPDLPADTVEALGAILEVERAREDDLFRDLSVLKSPDDVFRLAA